MTKANKEGKSRRSVVEDLVFHLTERVGKGITRSLDLLTGTTIMTATVDMIREKVEGRIEVGREEGGVAEGVVHVELQLEVIIGMLVEISRVDPRVDPKVDLLAGRRVKTARAQENP